MARLVDQVRAGESAALVVRGEAGIGKTALLHQCAGMASGFRVARIAGMQSEMELPFAGLHQLCGPMLAHVVALPDPQQDALRVALGLMAGDAPDRFLVALATLGLLAEVAQKRPLLCVVDDAQWLDAASGQVFGFVARRLLAESVLMLFAVRDPSEDQHLAGLAEMRLSGLADDDARAFLVAAALGRVDTRVRDRIVAETRGNPLALLELPRDMSAAELTGGFAGQRPGGLPGQLEGRFLRRFEALPEATQRLVLVAAADPTGDVALLWRAARALGIADSAAAEAEAGQLVEIGAEVQFRHPLVRSAIYAGASAHERRSVHEALATATDPEADPDRRAWHRALATARPDEEVASELERSASRAQARGGLAAAAAFLQRAVALTQDPERRADRALAAAQAQVQAGAFGEALRLLAGAEADTHNELQRARTDLLSAQIASASGGAEAPALLLKAARRLENLDVHSARETYLDALGAAMYSAQPAESSQLRDVANAARSAPPSVGPPLLSDLLLDGLSLFYSEGLATAAPTLRQAVGMFAGEELSVEKGLQWGSLAAAAAGTLWDFESMAAVTSRQTELARRAGALAPLCFSLSGDVIMLALRGDLAAAASLWGETEALMDVIGIRQAPIAALLLAALTGDEPRSSTLIQGAIDLARSRGEGTVANLGLWTSAILSNGLAHYDQALSPALQASGDEGIGKVNIAAWSLPEVIEAAVRTGNEATAADALERLADRTRWSGTDWPGAFLPVPKRLSETTRGRKSAIERPLNASAELRCGPSSPARTSSTVSGCAAKIAARTHATSSGGPTTCSVT